MLRRQLHPSGVEEFFRCGERFRRKYLERKPEPRSPALIVGTALDAVVMANMSEKIKTGSLLPEDLVTDMARDSVNEGFSFDVSVKRSEMLKEKTAAIARSLKFTQYAHRIFCNSILHPKSVQRRWSVRLDGLFARHGIKLAMDYVGTMDVEAWVHDFSSLVTGKPIGTAIHDLKTTRKAPGRDAAESTYWLQLTSYAAGKRVEDGEPPLFVQIDALVDQKRGVAHRIARAELNNYDEAALDNRLVAIGRSLEAGIFHPASRGSWMCSAKWCRYYQDCAYTKNKKTIHLKVPEPAKNNLVSIAGVK